MTLIHDELDEISRCCENVIPGTKVRLRILLYIFRHQF